MKLKYALALPLAALFVLPATMSASASIVTPSPVLTLPAQEGPDDITMCGGKLFASDADGHKVTAVDATGGVTTYNLPTGSDPRHFACSPTGAYLYVLLGTGHDSDEASIARMTVSSGNIEADFADLDNDYPSGDLVTNPEGDIFVTTTSATDYSDELYLAKVTPSGTVDNRFADLGIEYPSGFARGSAASGDIYVRDYNSILKVNESTGAVSTFANVPDHIGGLIVDRDNNVDVATRSGKVAKYAPNGTLLNSEFGRFTTLAPGDVASLTEDSAGTLYATDASTREITSITRAGVSRSLARFASSATPFKSVVTSGGIVYTASANDNTIYRIDLPALTPHITSAKPSNTVQGHDYTHTFKASGSDVTYTVANGSLPATFSLNPTTGVLWSYNSNATPGTYSFDVVASNAAGSDVQHVTFQLYRNVF